MKMRIQGQIFQESEINLSNKVRTVISQDSNQERTLFKCRDKELEIGTRTYIMGVLNLTPDSFYDGGKYSSLNKALKHVEQMIDEGADIIDVGGESTRPGSLAISLEEECQRVIPIIKEINKSFDTIISIDTTKSGVAYEALKEGASIVNDISGLKFDDKIADVAREFDAALVLTHTSSRPEDMQDHTDYTSLLDDIIGALKTSIVMAVKKGIDNQSILIDPGFGFGKTAQQNLMLLKNLSRLLELGKPILIGTSNKSFIGQTLDAEIDQRTQGTAATVAIGILNGASIVRVHDISYMKQVSKMVDAVLNVN
jgi:dihydropteroate synthase